MLTGKGEKLASMWMISFIILLSIALICLAGFTFSIFTQHPECKVVCGEDGNLKEKERCQSLKQLSNIGTWDGEWYEPSDCYLQRFSKAEAQQCLKGKKLAIVGDSAMADFWRASLEILGPMEMYSEIPELSDLKKEKIITTFVDKKNEIHLRYYALWRAEMWNQTGWILGNIGDNQNHTILSVLQNQSYDAVLLNIGVHHQIPGIGDGLKTYVIFVSNVAEFYDQKGFAPLIWFLMNAQYAPKTSADHQFQNLKLSQIFNEFAYWAFELVQARVRIPLLDVWTMMKAGFPDTSSDGFHASKYVDVMKWQVFLNMVCLPDHPFDAIIH